ncbi:hypothetical protein ABZ372_24880, partial [Streptomyces sp. NPDC005921]
EGDDPEVKEVCARLGVHHFTGGPTAVGEAVDDAPDTLARSTNDATTATACAASTSPGHAPASTTFSTRL